MPIRLVDLPDDCVVLCLLSMSVKDVMRMRMTCQRLSYITRFESLWTVLFRRCAGPGLIDHIRVLDDASRHLLEPFAIYADDLARRRAAAMRNESIPCILGPAEPGPLPAELKSHADRQHFSPDARWFVEVRGRWNVRVWDLLYRRMYVESGEMCAEAPAVPSSSAMYLSQDAKHLYVVVHGVREIERQDKRRARSNKVWESVMYLWTQDVPSQNMYNDPLIFPPTSRYSRSIRWLPRIQIRNHQCSSLDLNEDWISYFVHNTSEIVITEWTFGLDDPQERRCKGVILSCPELSKSGSLTPVWTRVSAGKTRRYLVWINAVGTILLFAVPALVVAPASVLSTITVQPLARLDLPFADVGLVTPMRALVMRDDGPFVFSLISQKTCCTVVIQIPTETPSTPGPPPSPRILLFSRKLPATVETRLCRGNCSFDPTGTLGVYFAQGTKQPAAAKLWALTAQADEESDTETHLSSSSISFHSSSSTASSSYVSAKSPSTCSVTGGYAKEQIGSTVVGRFEYVVFDEVSGLVCSPTFQVVQPNEPQVRECRVAYHPEVQLPAKTNSS